MIKEIGSEYWEDKSTMQVKHSVFDYLKIGADQRYAASGRSALYEIIEDMAIKEPIVYMPDYCCQSMIQPLLDYGCKIKYYKVNLQKKEFEINIKEKFDIFFAIDYFGYSFTDPDFYIDLFAEKGKIIIEDITHRLFSQKNYCKSSTYLFASLRKWLPIYSGGVAIKMSGCFKNAQYDNIDKHQIKLRKKAMILKKSYIDGKATEKEEYLSLYNESNELFKEYKHKSIDEESLKILKETDIDSIIKPRKKNTLVLHDIFMRNLSTSLLGLSRQDVPLFVPLFLKDKNTRDEVRKKAIEESIYLPIHWPIEQQPKSIQSDKELSLICDQRYSEKDIEEYSKKLCKIIEEVTC